MEKENRYTLINRSVAISANINLLLNQICNLWEWNGINHRFYRVAFVCLSHLIWNAQYSTESI